MEINLIELTKMDQLRVIHLGICVYGVVFLLATWGKTKCDKYGSRNQSMGLLYISFALLMWVALDLYRIIGMMKPGQVSVIVKTFSVYNNAFFIASLPFLYAGIDKLKSLSSVFSNSSRWALIVLVANVFIALLYSLLWTDKGGYSDFVKYFDAFYSAITFGLLGFAMIANFRQKGYFELGWIATFISFSLVFSQLLFLPFFKINHFDLISVILMISQFGLVLMVVTFSNYWSYRVDLENLLGEELVDEGSIEKKIAHLKQQNEEMRLELENLNLQMASDKAEKEIKGGIEKFSTLSDRELAVLQHIDKSYSEIGKALFISRETAISHKKNIEHKLGIVGKENLAEFAIKEGVIKAD